jgi:hypothetical protein
MGQLPDAGHCGRHRLLCERAAEGLHATMPEQYYWVHKRFKTWPNGLRCTDGPGGRATGQLGGSHRVNNMHVNFLTFAVAGGLKPLLKRVFTRLRCFMIENPV